MKVGIFTKSANHPRFEKMLHKFAEGVKASGDKVEIYTGDKYEKCDTAVIFGSWKDRPDAHHVVKNSVVKKAKNFIVCETPLIGRGPVANVMQDDWYRIGVNGFLADDGNFNNRNRPGDRWEKISDALKVDVQPYHSGSYIVVVLQVPGDASLRGQSIEKWAVDTCDWIRLYTDMPIVVRTPQVPKAFDMDLLGELEEIDGVQLQPGSKENLIPTLDGAWCTVTYSSGMGIDSLINGCPTIAMNQASFAYEISSNAIGEILDPECPDREQWLYDLSYAQWHVDEIKEGLPWRHLKEVL